MIRPASPGDEEALARINHAAWSAGDPPSVEELRERFAERLEQKTRSLLIAENDGEVQGFVSFADNEIHALYVDPSAWRQGIGRALIDKALAEMRTAGAEDAILWSLAEDARATRFYEANGFKSDGATRTRPEVGAAEKRFGRTL